MKNTVAIKEAGVFRQMYAKGRSLARPCIVVYWRRNRYGVNRLGLTAGKKTGNAVKRNRAKRVMKEAYRLLEPEIRTGYDIILVARTKTPHVPMVSVMRELKAAFDKAEIYNSSHPSLSSDARTYESGKQNA